MEKVRKVTLKDGRELVIRPALPRESCSITRIHAERGRGDALGEKRSA